MDLQGGVRQQASGAAQVRSRPLATLLLLALLLPLPGGAGGYTLGVARLSSGYRVFSVRGYASTATGHGLFYQFPLNPGTVKAQGYVTTVVPKSWFNEKYTVCAYFTSFAMAQAYSSSNTSYPTHGDYLGCSDAYTGSLALTVRSRSLLSPRVLATEPVGVLFIGPARNQTATVSFGISATMARIPHSVDDEPEIMAKLAAAYFLVVVLVSFILDVSLNCQRWADKSDDGGAGAARTADLRRGRVYFGGQLKPSDRVVLLNPLAMDQPGAMDDDSGGGVDDDEEEPPEASCRSVWQDDVRYYVKNHHELLSTVFADAYSPYSTHQLRLVLMASHGLLYGMALFFNSPIAMALMAVPIVSGSRQLFIRCLPRRSTRSDAICILLTFMLLVITAHGIVRAWDKGLLDHRQMSVAGLGFSMGALEWHLYHMLNITRAMHWQSAIEVSALDGQLVLYSHGKWRKELMAFVVRGLSDLRAKQQSQAGPSTATEGQVPTTAQAVQGADEEEKSNKAGDDHVFPCAPDPAPVEGGGAVIDDAQKEQQEVAEGGDDEHDGGAIPEEEEEEEEEEELQAKPSREDDGGVVEAKVCPPTPEGTSAARDSPDQHDAQQQRTQKEEDEAGAGREQGRVTPASVAPAADMPGEGSKEVAEAATVPPLTLKRPAELVIPPPTKNPLLGPMTSPRNDQSIGHVPPMDLEELQAVAERQLLNLPVLYLDWAMPTRVLGLRIVSYYLPLELLEELRRHPEVLEARQEKELLGATKLSRNVEDLKAEKEGKTDKRIHWACCLLSLGLWTLLLSTAVCYGRIRLARNRCMGLEEEFRPGCMSAAAGTCNGYGLRVGLWVVYVVYLLESLRSRSLSFLLNMKNSVADGAAFLDDLRRALPSITFSIECFHYEKKKVRNGDGQLVETDVKVKVVTGKYERQYVYNWVADHTPDYEYSAANVTKVKLGLKYGFKDEETEAEFNRQQKQFIEDHKDKDREYEFKGTSITLPGYSPFMMVVKREEDKPSAISAAGFLFYTSIGLSWPYRRWMDTLSLRRRTTVHKVFSNQLPADAARQGECVQYAGPR